MTNGKANSRRHWPSGICKRYLALLLKCPVHMFPLAATEGLPVSHILVVEDDCAVQEVISEFLRSTGHQVYCAVSAEEARRYLAEEPIQLALIDCLMSGEQGDSLAEHASSLGVPTILTSGDPNYLRTIPAGALPFLGKPFRLSELERLISEVLEKVRK